jgi:hypothetical protein
MSIPERYTQDPTDSLSPEQFQRARQAYINRKNAQNSTGPTSASGKAISSQNARRHGYAGASVVIEEEDRIAYDAHLDSYLQTFHPVTQPECDSVRRAANAQWRHDRLTSIETGLFDLDLSFDAPIIDAKVIGEPEFHHRLALSFLSHLNENARINCPLDLCRRYLSSAQRELERSIKLFYFLQKARIDGANTIGGAGAGSIDYTITTAAEPLKIVESVSAQPPPPPPPSEQQQQQQQQQAAEEEPAGKPSKNQQEPNEPATITSSKPSVATKHASTTKNQPKENRPRLVA